MLSPLCLYIPSHFSSSHLINPQFPIHQPAMHSTLLLILSSLLSLLTLPTKSINLNLSPSANFSIDYSRIIESTPIAVLKPKTPHDISSLLNSISSSPIYNNVTVAPRGAGHSTYGQSQAQGGVVINMTSMPSSIRVENTYVDAGGRALWVDVLRETLKHGLTPKSWTDYLYLTVGGTLSVGGVSGQAFKYGPQISNVIEMDVVTGKGDHVTCSKEKNKDLFFGVLGGLGQFGIITRARIPLKPAPKMAKRVTIPYEDFDCFTTDQELLISSGEVDYLEGFVKFKHEKERISHHLASNISTCLNVDTPTETKGRNPYYCIEFAIYYDNESIAQKKLERVLSVLSLKRSMVDEVDASYFEFLNRARKEELELRKRGLWEVAHPWHNLFVPRFQISRFRDLLLETISDSYNGGPIIVYPTLRDKWNPKMSAMTPQAVTEENIMYVASVLRSAPPSCNQGSQCLTTFLQQNQKIINIATSKTGQHHTLPKNATMDVATTKVLDLTTTHDFLETYIDVEKVGEGEQKLKRSEGGMGAKQYMPYLKNEEEWRAHFGEKWEWFEELKHRFDPLNILTPGQRIFKRKRI